MAYSKGDGTLITDWIPLYFKEAVNSARGSWRAIYQ
jgi:hypothetical protein